MTKKEQTRFLKRVTVISIVMSGIITIGVLAIAVLTRELSGASVASVCGLWGTELSMSALIKNAETKAQNKSQSKPKEENGVNTI